MKTYTDYNLTETELGHWCALNVALAGLGHRGAARAILTLAQKDGMDPKKLYQMSAETRLPEWPEPLPYEEVAPSMSLTPPPKST